MMNVQMSQTTRNVTDTGGTSRSLAVNTANFTLVTQAILGSSVAGTVVGTSSQAIAIGDTKLVAQANEGTGSGQMHHLAQESTAPATSGTTRSMTTTRSILNDSGSAIVLAECGIYVTGGAASVWDFCVARDLISPTISVPNLGAITVRYTLGITV